MTDFAGALYRQYAYDPYGNVISVKDGAGVSINMSTDEFNHAYTYAGYRYDKETGLYFLNARYYAAGIGRFLTKDTWKGESTDPQTLNRYSYALGDPINFVDHSGHRPGVSGGPEGLDAYNSVSETPYRPAQYVAPTVAKAGLSPKDIVTKAGTAATYVGIAVGVVGLGVIGATAVIGSTAVLATIGTVAFSLGLLAGGVAAISQSIQYGMGWDPSSRKVILAWLGAAPPLRILSVGGTALGGIQAAAFKITTGSEAFSFIRAANSATNSGAIGAVDGFMDIGAGIGSLY